MPANVSAAQAELLPRVLAVTRAGASRIHNGPTCHSAPGPEAPLDYAAWMALFCLDRSGSTENLAARLRDAAKNALDAPGQSPETLRAAALLLHHPGRALRRAVEKGWLACQL